MDNNDANESNARATCSITNSINYFSVPWQFIPLVFFSSTLYAFYHVVLAHADFIPAQLCLTTDDISASNCDKIDATKKHFFIWNLPTCMATCSLSLVYRHQIIWARVCIKKKYYHSFMVIWYNFFPPETQ